ncbi:uncharacterized protein BCR38DRAFT_445802 [Pseudomassariella vexata]|uniref:Nephrocystin 3-like N-terminal domain-containing protein n=1 Tax=Pseudomassariella vexata TaxID=1141098 RepID=A0A1Y2DIV8_9PEZI|nr:uncharacterized protein BCR38DRAFT_445802 [Pseudomassariella vexata]ORY59167.1 hypothetical protein BCR38DRAFT_445802 [Pseudomassariella vexata]
MPTLKPELYTVAWIAPLEIEARAALQLLDHRHDGGFPMSRGDDYVFQAGDICGHNVIIATLPAGQEYGTGSAAALASQVKRFFPNLWFGLLVGVAAGLPDMDRKPQRDIRLGDILVGLPDMDHAGLVAYDLGREMAKDGFQLLRCGQILAHTETVVRSAIGSIKLRAPDDTKTFLPYFEAIKDREHADGTFADPGEDHDHLYRVNDDGTEYLVQRSKRHASKRTRVWYGSIGSGDKLIKNAQIRDQLKRKYGLIGLEMEAAGTMNRIPVGVVRGVCDYADEHKNKTWQPYAAAMAAAYAKAILCEIRAEGLGDASIPAKRKYSCEEETVTGSKPRKRTRSAKEGPTSDLTMIQTSRTEATLEPCNKNGRRIQRLSADQKMLLIESLYFDEIDARQRSIRTAHNKTCKWLLDAPEWRDWLNTKKLEDHHGFLWIKGKPGTGKSTLMEFASSYAFENMDGEMSIIAFFFSARGGELEKTTIGLYRSLLSQLLAQRPELECILELPGIPRGDGPLRPQWTIESLTLLLRHAIKKLGTLPLICFIDALDECDETQIREMISVLESCSKTARSAESRLHICLASRHYPHITIEKGLEITLERQAGHVQDIAQYLCDNLRIRPLKLSAPIRSDIQDKASGVFIWVVLVVGLLNKEYDRGRIHSLRQRLQETPPDLNALFYDIVTRNNQDIREFLLCIQWVLFTSRPLSPRELYFAIITGTEPNELKDCHFTSLVISKEVISNFILDVSKGLVEIVHDDQPIVQFIHESVREFLLREDGMAAIATADTRNRFEGTSHHALTQCCLHYIKTSVAGRPHDPETGAHKPIQTHHHLSESLINTWPFLKYATENILYHAGAAQASGVDQSSFLQGFRLEDWVLQNYLLFASRGIHKGKGDCPNETYLEKLFDNNRGAFSQLATLNTPGLDVGEWRLWTPIIESIASGDQVKFQSHLKARANTLRSEKLHTDPQRQKQTAERNSIVDIGRQSLSSWEASLVFSAAEQGDDELLTLVLAGKNIKMDFRDEHGRTPMMVAQDVRVVEVLIDNGAEINSKSRNGLTPLTQFVLKQNYTVVELLLKRGAEVNGRNERNDTPLFWVAGSGMKQAASVLLDHGASVDMRASDGLTPLAWAARSGNIGVAALLLEKGASAESADNELRTPLMWATQNQRMGCVALLLKKGANPNSADAEGRTPLSWAAAYNYCHILYLLLENGASVVHPDRQGKTPRDWAREGKQMVAEYVLRSWEEARSVQDRDNLFHFILERTIQRRSTTDTIINQRRKKGGSRCGYN